MSKVPSHSHRPPKLDTDFVRSSKECTIIDFLVRSRSIYAYTGDSARTQDVLPTYYMHNDTCLCNPPSSAAASSSSSPVRTIPTVPICTTNYELLLQLNINLHQRIFSTRPANPLRLDARRKKEHADWTGLPALALFVPCRPLTATRSRSSVGASHKASTWHAVYARLTKLVSGHCSRGLSAQSSLASRRRFRPATGDSRSRPWPRPLAPCWLVSHRWGSVGVDRPSNHTSPRLCYKRSGSLSLPPPLTRRLTVKASSRLPCISRQ